MKQPEGVHLSREEGEVLLARLETNTLTAEDRQVLGKVLTFYFQRSALSTSLVKNGK